MAKQKDTRKIHDAFSSTLQEHASSNTLLKLLISIIVLLPEGLHAVPSYHGGLVQANSLTDVVPIQGTVFNRQEYLAVGGYILLDPMVWNPATEQWEYAVQPGDSWSIEMRDTQNDRLIATESITYLGGERHCWTKFCDPITAWWVAWELRCMPEQNRYRIETYHGSRLLGESEFQPTPFVAGQPKVTVSPDRIAPYIPSRGTPDTITYLPEIPAGTANVVVSVIDNLNCGAPQEDVEVTLKSFIRMESGGHLHFKPADLAGTGVFLSGSDFDGVRNQISGKTDANGIFQAEYRADKLGIDESIIAEIKQKESDDVLKSKAAALHIALPGLVPLNLHSDAYSLCGTGSDEDLAHNRAACGDRESHYLTPSTRSKVEAINQAFIEIAGFGLSFNDASLPQGGIFDSGIPNLLDPDRKDPNELFNPELNFRRDDSKRRGDHESHQAHRHGTEIDINRGGVLKNCPQPRNLRCDYEGDVEEFKGHPRWEIIKILTERDHKGWMAGYAPGGGLHIRFQE